jgi:hypothetical protein
MKKYVVVLNEQHSLIEQQQELLNNTFKMWDYLRIPTTGLNLDEMKELINALSANTVMIFASPIPAMMSLLNKFEKEYIVFHNDNRDKKELPNGKIIFTVAKEGWELV